MSQFKINSLVSPAPFVGITNQGQSYVPVQLNPSDDLWTIAPQPDQSVRFKIGSLDYTGMDDQGTVVVSNDPGKDVKWRVTHHSDCDAFTIEVLDVNPVVGWSVADYRDSASQIVVRQIDVSQCNPWELFTIVPAQA